MPRRPRRVWAPCPPAPAVPSDALGKPTRASSQPGRRASRRRPRGCDDCRRRRRRRPPGDRASTAPVARETSTPRRFTPPRGRHVRLRAAASRRLSPPFATLRRRASGEHRGAAAMSPATAAGGVRGGRGGGLRWNLETRAQTHLWGTATTCTRAFFQRRRTSSRAAERRSTRRFAVSARSYVARRCAACCAPPSVVDSIARRLPRRPGGGRRGDGHAGTSRSPPGDVRLARAVGGAATLEARHGADYHAGARFSPFEASSSRAAEIPSARIARSTRENSGARASTSATSTCESAKAASAVGGRDAERAALVGVGAPIRISRRGRLRPSTLRESKPKKMDVGTTTGAVVQIDYPERRLAVRVPGRRRGERGVSDGTPHVGVGRRIRRVWPEDFSASGRNTRPRLTSASASAEARARPRRCRRGIARRPRRRHAQVRDAARDRTRASSPPSPRTRTRTSSPPRPPTAPRGRWSSDTGEQLYEFDAPGERATTCAFAETAAERRREEARRRRDARPPLGTEASRPSGRELVTWRSRYAGGYVRVFDVDGAHLVAEHRRGDRRGDVRDVHAVRSQDAGGERRRDVVRARIPRLEYSRR